MQFDSLALDDRLQKAVKAVGFTDATPIQEAAIPPALEARDVIGTAQTGTGKTAAFVLPTLQHLLTHERTHESGRTRALIVTPTRELAEQVHDTVRDLAKFTRLRSATVYGGVGFDKQEKALLKSTEVIVACPGRLLDHCRRRNANLRGVEVLILDEADRMLDMGFLPDVRRIVARCPADRQTMLFGATLAPELEDLASDILHDPQRVQVGIVAPAKTVEHTLCPVAHERKTDILFRLLNETDSRSILIFTRTKHRADRLTSQISRAGYKAVALHSNKSQSARQRALDGFRKGDYQLMIATDIAARGLDIASVTHVINYDIPDCADAYIHRIGRTGRAHRTGDAFTLVTADDCATVREIEKALGECITVRKIEGFDYGVPTGRGGGRHGRQPATPTSFKSSQAKSSSSAGGWRSTRRGRRPVARGPIR